MRMLPAAHLPLKNKRGTPQLAKGKPASKVAHFSAPLKGLSLRSELTEGDPLLASVLTNWVVEDDRITVRPGYRMLSQLAAHTPISTLIPYYGEPSKLAAASAGSLYDTAGVLLSSGYGNDYWSWTSFSNLSTTDYTVMVNGVDGVVSWDGAAVPAGPVVAVTSISKTNPAQVTVAAADISKFTNGMVIRIAGAVGDFAVCNGTKTITSVNTPVNTFTLPGVNLAAATGTSGAGITAQPFGSFVKEAITVGAETWINPLRFDKVISHMNRLWFADSDNLAIYYLPLQTKTGTVELFPLDVLFKRGGHIVAMHAWSIDGGSGLDDALVIFSSNGEAVIYSGVDPESDFKLVGIFRFDSPMSKESIINFGGDLYVMISTGFVPMTTMIRAETEQLGKSDLTVMKEFETVSKLHRADFGWQVLLNQHSNHAICNMPIGSGKYRQMVRKMPGQIWARWDDVPARCWGWLDNHAYFGTDDGRICVGGTEYLNDNGAAINADVRFSWSNYKSLTKKNFKMVRLYAVTDGVPRPFIDMEVDYNNVPPTNQPDISIGSAASWDTATWDVDYWAGTAGPQHSWQGVTGLGRVGAPRVRISVLNVLYSLTGLDVLYEPGGLL